MPLIAVNSPPSSRTRHPWAGCFLLAVTVLAASACDQQDARVLLKSRDGSALPPPSSGDGGPPPLPAESDGGTPTNPCAATLCMVGTHCEDQVVSCAAAPCPHQGVCVKDPPPPPACPLCTVMCPADVLDAKGCPVCGCPPPPPPVDPCAVVKCSSGFHCESTVVMCIQAPCPPIGSCVPDAPVVRCGGFAGIPCPGAGRCGDDPTDSCDPAKGGADCGGICTCVQNVACVKGATFDSSPRVCACVGGGVVGTLKDGQGCGGLQPPNAPTCAAGSFCQHQPGALCGAADAPGICVKVPDGCTTMVMPPVCGCDGKTYGGVCLATMAKMGILHLGACP